MADFIKAELEELGVSVKFVKLGSQTLDGEKIDLPPAILASIGNDPKKKTICLYAHYDVQPVSRHRRSYVLRAPLISVAYVQLRRVASKSYF